MCCCRGIEQEELSDSIQCDSATPPRITSVTQCGCVSCDDLEVTVTLVVVAVGTSKPITAARVFRMDSTDGLTLLGITNNFGVFRYRELAGVRTVVFQVQAAGYVTQSMATLHLLPSTPTVRREVVLMPSLSIEVGLGGSPLVLRLGSILSVSASPRSFLDMNGEVYEDMISFNGNVFEVEDEASRSAIPQISFFYTDPQGVERLFSMLVGLVLDFVDRFGQRLTNPGGLQVSVSVMNDGSEPMDVFLVSYHPLLDVWTRTSKLFELEPFRRKRQNSNPIIFNGRGEPLGVFVLIVTGRDINCWLQARMFEDVDGTVPPITANAVVTMRQDALLLGNIVLVQFIGETNQFQTTVDGLQTNALCLPLACDSVETLLVASDAATLGPLLPVDFEDTVFDDNETTPIILSTSFLFTQAAVARVNNSRPFYSSRLECTEAGQENDSVAEPADYFTFRTPDDVELRTPTSSDQCFIKILINDCFLFNEVIVNSINVVTGTITSSETFDVFEPVTPDPTTAAPTTGFTTAFTTDATTTDGMTTADDDDLTSSGDGMTTVTEETTTTEEFTTTEATTPVPTTAEATTPGPTPVFVCNDETSTVRGACLPYVCGDNFFVLVRMSNESDVPSGFCAVTRRSVLLTDSPFTNDDIFNQFSFISVVNPGQGDLSLTLLTTDYNDPNLGLYTDTGGNDMANLFAEQRCNAGVGGDIMSDTIDLSVGYATVFSCF